MADRPRKALILARGSRRLSRVERQVLERVEQALPEGTEFQIWTNLEISDSKGEPHEIDAIALGHYGLYVVGVKHIPDHAIGDEQAQVVDAMRRQHVVKATLDRVCANSRLLQDFLLQELGREAASVEPLILVPNENVEIVLPHSIRRNVVTAEALIRGLQSGELPGDVAPPDRVPVDASTAHAIANLMGGLPRRIRPGHGNLQQELSLLQRDIVADLREVIAAEPGLEAQNSEVQASEFWGRIEEVAAAWVIACVFVWALEELGLIERRLMGEGSEERARAFLAESPSRTPRDYLIHLLSTVGEYPACESIVGQRSEVLRGVSPSQEGAAALLSFFRGLERTGRNFSELEDHFERLWGELYEGISTPLQRANASIQTPEIVEEFLLDRTLALAIAEIGVSGVTVIDPACGSGTLLVGAFRRLLAARSATPSSHQALAALDQVHGVDISPVATMITRIRLLLAYRRAVGCKRLSDVPALPFRVVTADSLLPPPGGPLERLLDLTVYAPPGNVLLWKYSVVVCAPPLITPRDPALRHAYRERYRSAALTYPLFSPFVERCFQLAEHGGFVGMLVGNSFMKQKFGKPLVEEVLPALDLTHVIDTSGAYIPGYGAPTVMLLGRNRPPSSATIRVVVGKRGEPIAPIRPAEGRVWSSIVTHLEQVDYEDAYIAVNEVSRARLTKHPWSLGARNVMAVRDRLEQGSVRLEDLGASIHQGAWSRLAQVYVMPKRMAERLGLESEVLRPLVQGASIRDFSFSIDEVALDPVERDLPRSMDQLPRWWMWLQRYQPLLVSERSGSLASVPWWAWLRAPRSGGTRPRIIGPRIARKPHFALAPGELVASSTVLVIEPGAATSETELYSWLGFLSSSTASFWIKQVAHSKGPAHGGAGPEELVYEFSGGVVGQLPIPRMVLESGALRDDLVALTRQLGRTARELAATAPEQVMDRWDRSSRETLMEALGEAQLRERTLLRRMVCEQEDLDWLVYEAIGLPTGERHILKGSASPEQRPFVWLTDEPPTGLDRRLTEPWRFRRKALQAHGGLQILESAPYKRTFRDIDDDRGVDLDEVREESDLDVQLPAREHRDSTDYAQRTSRACERWLLDRLEEIFRDAPPRCASVQELASRLHAMDGAPFVVAMLVREHAAVSAAVLERYILELLRSHAVPYLAALRHTEHGLEKRARWEESWVLLRRQDAGAHVTTIPMPPPYDRVDYRDASVFRHRGRLDVPTERFIAYPGEGDAEPRYGWAGWTPVQQAEALIALVEQCRGAGEAEELAVPLLAGILELVWWMPSWNGAITTPGSPAELFQLRVRNEVGRLGLHLETLRAWRPVTRDQRRQGQ